MTIGLQLSLANDQNTFRSWVNGKQLLFGWAADCVRNHLPIAALERHLLIAVGDSLFRQKSSNQVAGFTRRLFRELCDFTHGGPTFTNADIWQSNGPIFVPNAFEKWAVAFIKTYALAILEAKLAEPKLVTLSYCSSSSVGSLFEKAISTMPEQEDGFIVFNAIPENLWATD